MRDQLAVDFAGTMAALAAIGYRRVEHAGFVGRTVQEFKAVTDANDIWVSSGHVSIPQPFDEAAWDASLQDALVLGSTYIVHPFFGIDFGTGEGGRDTATWAAFAEDLNKAGRMAQDVGLRWATQPQLGVLPAHRQPGDDRVRRPRRGDRSPRRPLRDGPVLGDAGRA